MLTRHASSIRAELAALREAAGCDFAALAWKDSNGYAVRWRFASGETNDRYTRIVLQPGQGIAGTVLRTERPYLVNTLELRSGEDPRQYAIMLAEQLQSAAGHPVTAGGAVRGVALLGFRESNRRIEEPELAALRDAAARIGAAIDGAAIDGAASGDRRRIAP
ncbi:GAF domain-containing protein [Paenibacillus antri]|uniref:GAF domain-containing protein n=1 Tax=Paenibacillus antri TaxID=2582848 RepID=A0A5R9GGC0_9BACL|nr:GAF domain-containing protein [Paenibacillus antri]TLS50445.1 GAF domain-containing protein [Paenibacillus antri]